VVREWYDSTPQGFLFAFKASRFLTHNKKLKDPRDPLKRVLKAAEGLREKLGPILFQLPPHWRVNMERLESFLKILPKDFEYVFEFREPSWFCEPVYEALHRRQAAFCIYSMRGVASLQRPSHPSSSMSVFTVRRGNTRVIIRWLSCAAGRRKFADGPGGAKSSSTLTTIPKAMPPKTRKNSRKF
jgi:uncharacterized protein YecE (DUF72 family)